ncbi:MAG: Tm-1-like ATP-binding domain-containing protein [Deltaproteobacteria bacterium]|nr:Tm-1-like ATP-binding domain-containing protein [Deltaproteobacteria bacterium]
MDSKNIVIIGTLDTKGEQIRFLKDQITQEGHKTSVFDLSMGGAPLFEGDITPQEIAQAGGEDIENIRSSKDRATITQAMQVGAIEKIKQLFSDGKVDGIIAAGGISMAITGSNIMKAIPFGVPKMIVCPAAMPSYVAHCFGSMDVAIMQSIVEFAGLNKLLKDVLARAAGAICGMAEKASFSETISLSRNSIAITQFGFSENCASYVLQYLEEKGYTVYPFHAQGISDRAMDSLISQGYFDGVIDIVPAGVIEEIFEGNRAAGRERLEAAGKRGIPQVIGPCALNWTGCGPTRKQSEKYASRERVLKVDKLRAATRYNVQELKIGAKAYAEKLNKSKGPVKIIFPLQGWSSIDREGTILYKPDEDMIFIKEMKKYLKPAIEIEYIDCNLEEPPYARALVDSLDSMMKKK